MRLIVQNAAQEVHEGWLKNRDVIEQEFASGVVPTLASGEDNLSTPG